MKKTTYALQKALQGRGHVLDLRGVRPGRYTKEGVLIYDIIPPSKKEAPQPKQKRKPYVAKKSTPYKILTILLIVLFSLSNFYVGPTLSYYNNIEESRENLFNAGLIDFVLEAHPFAGSGSEITSGTSTLWGIDIFPNSESNPFYYHASSTNFYGDQDFCESIDVVATVNDTILYSGKLQGLLSATTTDIAVWTFAFSSQNIIPNSVCHFDIDFNGRQTRHNLTEGGFTDTETVQYWLSSGGIVINKVYFEHIDKCGECEAGGEKDKHSTTTPKNIEIINNNDANITNTVVVSANTGGNSASGASSTITTGNASASSSVTNIVNTNTTTISGSSKSDHEWIELYNQTNTPINISGWQLCNGHACDEIPDVPVIPPHGFAIIANNQKAFEEINIPDGVVKILIPNGAVCGNLHNKHDMLVLMRPDLLILDQMNWGTPDMLWQNYNNKVWDPGIPTPKEGSVLARIPTGHDTDSPEDFFELQKPKLKKFGIENKAKYYSADTYKIYWDARNPNGEDDALRVDLYYVIDGVDVPIAENTPNDGEFHWTVPHNLEGRVYVKIVVTSPENILLNITKKKKIHLYIKYKKEKGTNDDAGSGPVERPERPERPVRDEEDETDLLTEEGGEDEGEEEGDTATSTKEVLVDVEEAKTEETEDLGEEEIEEEEEDVNEPIEDGAEDTESTEDPQPSLEEEPIKQEEQTEIEETPTNE